MSKITPLLPSQRERKRYLAYEVLSNKNREFAVVSSAIQGSCLKVLGELECSRAGIQVLPERFNSNKGIIRVDNKYTDHLKTALCFVHEIDGEPVIVRSTGVSGMIKKANKYLS